MWVRGCIWYAIVSKSENQDDDGVDDDEDDDDGVDEEEEDDGVDGVDEDDDDGVDDEEDDTVPSYTAIAVVGIHSLDECNYILHRGSYK